MGPGQVVCHGDIAARNTAFAGEWAVVRKVAAGIPTFVPMEREGILVTLDSQHRAAEQLRPLIAHAAAAASSDMHG